MAGREVVEADDVLVECAAALDEMRADEPGAAGDEPAPARRGDGPLKGVVAHRHARGPRQSRQTGTPRAAQRAGVHLALDVDEEPARLELRDEVVDRPRLELAVRDRGDDRGARGSASHGTSSTPYSCVASAGSATGSCTCTLAPYDSSSRTTSITRELRRSGSSP